MMNPRDVRSTEGIRENSTGEGEGDLWWVKRMACRRRGRERAGREKASPWVPYTNRVCLQVCTQVTPDERGCRRVDEEWA